ncbi:MAG: ELWxxDGT repeat protein [Aureispira sp.]|jgi:ELWxxDGT repeat protein
MLANIPPIILSFLGLFLVYNASFAQQAKRLSNINQYSQTRQTTSQISTAIDFNNKSIQVQRSIHGNELWEYDGINPPSLIMDIYPGTQNGVGTDLIVFDNKVFFAGNDGINGYELWAYDGINLPYMVAELNSNGNSSPQKFTIFQNKLYFTANTNTQNNLVWVYDGTNPPSHAPALNSPNSNSFADAFIVFDNQFFCARFNTNIGRELYRYDGTNAPILVQDIAPGSANSNPRNFIVYDNKLFFTASNGVVGEELWSYDGTQATLVADINPGAYSAFFSSDDFSVYNNQLIFSADNGINGKELWAYDGTQLNILDDLYPGPIGSEPENLTVLNNKLYFSCSEGSIPYLWAYDGTDIDTVTTEILNLRAFSVFQDKLLFQGDYNYSINGVIYWDLGSFIYDGVSEPQLIGKKRTTTDASSVIKNLSVYKDMLYFSALNELNETKLWSFNGSSEDPNSVQPIQNSYVSYPENLIVHKDKLYFSGQIDDQNNLIWQYDGMNRPTAFSDSFPLNNVYINSVGNFCEYKDQLFFTSNNYATSNYELWSINEGQLSAIIGDSILYKKSSPRDLLVYKGDLYFVLNSFFNGEELWKYDGEQLTLITDLSPDFTTGSNQNILDLTIFKDKIYFNAWDGTGPHLWSYDGLNPPVIESNASNVSGYRSELIVFQDKLYYVGYNNQTGRELWVYDGSNPSYLVADLTICPHTSSFPNSFVVLKDQLYFSAFSEHYGTELWAYDGINTPKVVADITQNILSSNPTDLRVMNDKLYFAADDGIHGIELWEYNPDTTQQQTIETPSDLQAILYPNPSNGSVNINFEYLCLNPRVRVVNTNGQVILDKKFTSTDNIKLYLDRANTIYFIRIDSEDGQCLHRKVVMN